MRATAVPALGAAFEAALRQRVLSPEPDAELVEAVRRVLAVAEGSIRGVVFFGSRRTGASGANRWSAYDVFVIVPAYRPFYEAMRRGGLTGKRPALLSLVSRWLPPTQFSLRLTGTAVHLKATVIRLDTFLRETSAGRRDHFCIGRLFQPSRILHASSDETRDLLVAALASAHAETWGWVRPWLAERFDAEAYARTALEVSMSFEVRPEPGGRAGALWEAQREEQIPVFEALLAELGRAGALAPAEGGGFRTARSVGFWERVRTKAYFRRSLLRATARWLKHTVSFEGWLDYILRKASRHGGEAIELTERERRWPWIFLWGRLLRHVRTRSRRGGAL